MVTSQIESSEKLLESAERFECLTLMKILEETLGSLRMILVQRNDSDVFAIVLLSDWVLSSLEQCCEALCFALALGGPFG